LTNPALGRIPPKPFPCLTGRTSHYLVFVEVSSSRNGELLVWDLRRNPAKASDKRQLYSKIKHFILFFALWITHSPQLNQRKILHWLNLPFPAVLRAIICHAFASFEDH
jgi:hypothetical protein